jgi:uncharacterized protein (TIGR02266 family)
MTQRSQHSSEDVSVAEAELTRQEEAMEVEVARLKALRATAEGHLARARQLAEDPSLLAALGHLEVPSVTVKELTEEAARARLKALGVRKLCVERARAALREHEADLEQLFERVQGAEQVARHRAVQRSAELVAHAVKRPPPPQRHAEAEALEEAEVVEAEVSLEATMLREVSQPLTVLPARGSRVLSELRSPPASPPPAPLDEHRAAELAQRRATVRAALCAEISLGSDSNFFTGFTNDISEGGLFVATVELLPIGSQIDLVFTLPNGPRIEGKGEVRWVRELDELNPEVFPGMGIKFTELSPASVRAIHAFTEHREPMFFPEH